ncbi:DUF983 domain-containing protein [Leeuwenhoekiella sp. ZYFB001]|uniref:DUF983 domain-containing protein n=1 Tax=Leeuwenhoekiella sp. ZYFB001 TaxID=2719912 RepID=UPI00142F6870|nr:DUF983 domain-containing protein [Leeuwenhoekiella sp. ZYFB001]
MNTIINILKGTCPNCEEGSIFKTKGNIFLLRMPKMNERCKTCNHKFEKETGFFFGAMFVSYALAVAEMIASLVLFWMVMDLSPLLVFLIIAAIAFVTSTFNFRLSRTIWIYLFN